MIPETTKRTITTAYRSIIGQAGFRSRLGQRTMIAEAAKTLSDAENRIIVAEAPTGTGKSLAYLLASLPVAQALGKKVVIATSTVALQEQIFHKDLPRFLAASGFKSSYVLAKGRGRYLCPVKLSAATGYSGNQGDMFGMPTDELLRPEQVHQAMRDAIEDGSWDGDRDSFPVTVSDDDWVTLTMDRRGCMGNSCRFLSQCPAVLARERVGAAEVVIANHDLLLSDLAIGGGVVLPDPAESIIVIDEAHALPGRARNHFGRRVSLRSLDIQISSISQILMHAESFDSSLNNSKKDRDLTSDARSEAKYLSSAVSDIHAMIDGGFSDSDADYTKADGCNQARFYRGVVPLGLSELTGVAAASAKSLYKTLEKIGSGIKKAVADGKVNQSVAEMVIGQIGSIAGHVSSAMEVFDDYADAGDSGVLVARWIESSASKDGVNHVLEKCSTDVSGLLFTQLWSVAYGAVVTSATLTAMGRFEHFRREAGLPFEPSAVYLKLSSPFDYSKAFLRIPRHDSADSSNHKVHTAYLAMALPDLIEESGGTLVLFASRKQMQEVREAMPDDIQQIILCQDELPRRSLLDEHGIRVGNGLPSVIFGLASFAEGVDLPGDLCKHVVIAKLPFDPPGSPADATIAEDIESRGGNVFREVVLPKTCLRLIQAVGRLLRTENDEGIISILDSRLHTKRYGKELLGQLPKELVTIP